MSENFILIYSKTSRHEVQTLNITVDSIIVSAGNIGCYIFAGFQNISAQGCSDRGKELQQRERQIKELLILPPLVAVFLTEIFLHSYSRISECLSLVINDVFGRTC